MRHGGEALRRRRSESRDRKAAAASSTVQEGAEGQGGEDEPWAEAATGEGLD